MNGELGIVSIEVEDSSLSCIDMIHCFEVTLSLAAVRRAPQKGFLKPVLLIIMLGESIKRCFISVCANHGSLPERVTHLRTHASVGVNY